MFFKQMALLKEKKASSSNSLHLQGQQAKYEHQTRTCRCKPLAICNLSNRLLSPKNESFMLHVQSEFYYSDTSIHVSK